MPFPFRNRVVATLGKGIAAQNAPNGENQSDNEAPFSKGFDGVSRTGRLESAAGRLKRGNELLIKFHQINTDVFHLERSPPCSCEGSRVVFGEDSSKSESFFAA